MRGAARDACAGASEECATEECLLPESNPPEKRPPPRPAGLLAPYNHG